MDRDLRQAQRSEDPERVGLLLCRRGEHDYPLGPVLIDPTTVLVYPQLTNEQRLRTWPVNQLPKEPTHALLCRVECTRGCGKVLEERTFVPPAGQEGGVHAIGPSLYYRIHVMPTDGEVISSRFLCECRTPGTVHMIADPRAGCAWVFSQANAQPAGVSWGQALSGGRVWVIRSGNLLFSGPTPGGELTADLPPVP